MDLVDVFAVLLLLAIGAGMFTSWDRRAREARRAAQRGGRRSADEVRTEGTEPT